jgi:hypothetical protein
MKRINLDKIASATGKLDLSKSALISSEVTAAPGYVIAVRALDKKEVYNKVEDPAGRMVKIYPGDVIACVLGERKALQGYEGKVPDEIAVGDTLHLLNLGGVVGLCTSFNPMVGSPMRVEVLGAVLTFPVFESRQGVPAHIKMKALDPVDALGSTPPVVFVSGTCMNSGKTLAACEIVRSLSRAGLKVGAAKLTGVSLRRDTLAMVDCGARRALSFSDAGYPSTSAETAPAAARAVLSALASPSAETLDVIVAELGDGLLGEYGVLPILKQPDILGRKVVHVCCASDPVGAFGAAAVFEAELSAKPHIFTGPVTDNRVGCAYIQDQLGVEAINACQSPKELGAAVLEKLESKAVVKILNPKNAEVVDVAV